MPRTMNVAQTLRKALANLRAERDRIDRQIAALQTVIGGEDRGRRAQRASSGRRRRSRRKPMSAAARQAVSRRMKAYWAAKRKGQAAKAAPKKSA